MSNPAADIAWLPVLASFVGIAILMFGLHGLNVRWFSFLERRGFKSFVGPLNLYLFVRDLRRHWTVDILAIVAGMTIFFYPW
jgi:hypothetical protein